MFKPTILKVIIAVVLGGGAFFVASNAHFDPFPCEVADLDWETKRLGPMKSENCSLLDVKRSGEPMADHAKLAPGGYAIAVVLFGLLPYLLGCVIGHMIGRKKQTA